MRKDTKPASREEVNPSAKERTSFSTNPEHKKFANLCENFRSGKGSGFNYIIPCRNPSGRKSPKDLSARSVCFSESGFELFRHVQTSRADKIWLGTLMLGFRWIDIDALGSLDDKPWTLPNFLIDSTDVFSENPDADQLDAS